MLAFVSLSFFNQCHMISSDLVTDSNLAFHMFWYCILGVLVHDFHNPLLRKIIHGFYLSCPNRFCFDYIMMMSHNVLVFTNPRGLRRVAPWNHGMTYFGSSAIYLGKS